MTSIGLRAGVGGTIRAASTQLHGRDVASLSGSPLLDRTMPLVNYLPRRAREWVYSIGGMTEAVSQREVGKLNFDDIAEWITSLLPKRSYPGVFIGSSNELGAFESGATAAWFGRVTSVVGGGIATIVVVVVVRLLWPEIVRIGPLHQVKSVEENVAES